MKIPRPLQDRELLAFVETLDAQFQAQGKPGSFSIEFHYGPTGEPKKAKLIAPGVEFTLKKDLTPKEIGAEDGPLT